MTVYRKNRLQRLLRLLPVIALLIAALACNAPTGPDTQAETATAQFATALAGGTTGTPIAGATTNTTQIANTPTNPPANSTATNTAAPQQCVVTAKTAVNIRNGPSTFHPILRILAEGATGVVTGRNSDTSWWQIDGSGWVSAPYVTTSGPCTGISVASYPPAPPTNTPPPTATYTPTITNTPTNTATSTGTVTVTATYTNTAAPVDFTVAFVSPIKDCGPAKYASISISNIGTNAIESVTVDAEGPVGTDVGAVAFPNTPFKGTASEGLPGCAAPGATNLAPATGAYIYVALSSVPTTGTAGKATITACSAENGGGTCVTKSITFNW